jgi:hypothetical protein
MNEIFWNAFDDESLRLDKLASSSSPGKGTVDSKAGPSARSKAHRAAAKRLLKRKR